MAGTGLRIGIVGCGSAARAHANRLRAIDGVTLVGCADPDASAARSLAEHASTPDRVVPAFEGHAELLRVAAPAALAVFTPHPTHYRPAMDALQAGCHLFIEAPLSTVAQEAVDVAGLAKGRGLHVAVSHPFRLLPALAKAREMLAGGAIGRVVLVTATLAQPWLASRRGSEDAWRFDARVAGGGILADSGVHLLDALLWTTGRAAESVAAIQSRDDSGLDLVTAAVIGLAGGTLAALAVSGLSPSPAFEVVYHGEAGRLRATEGSLVEESGDGLSGPIPLPDPAFDVVADFVGAVTSGVPPCCPAAEAIDSVRLLEAIARSATIGQFVGLA